MLSKLDRDRVRGMAKYFDVPADEYATQMLNTIDEIEDRLRGAVAVCSDESRLRILQGILRDMEEGDDT